MPQHPVRLQSGGTAEAAGRCSISGCDQHSRAIFDLRQLCVEHFISMCYEKLAALSNGRHLWSADDAASESASHMIQECVERAGEVSKQKSEFSNLERARLLDISLWATELSQQVRRGPRSALTISVRLISERPGRHWEEETQTLDMSHHGARMLCQRGVETGDILKVVRIDTGKRIKARVVWQRQIQTGAHEIGIEFVHEGDTLNE